MEPRLNIAVVGAGISGLAAAWLLAKRHRVTLFEREGRPGGHANTVDVPVAGGAIPVDAGFIVYNTASYPNLIALFDHLGVPTAKSDMSFAVSLGGGAYEYSGSGFSGVFGQAANLVNISHLGMLLEIRRFFGAAPRLLALAADHGLSLGDYLAANRYSKAFIARHIVPMAAAIWSTPAARVLDFPAVSFARFCANHGLLQVRGRPQWRTVVGGSRVYVHRLLEDFAGEVVLDRPAVRIERGEAYATVIDRAGRARCFDACVVATHADDALALLADADAVERAGLGAFRYQANRAVLHRDASFMPRRRRIWSSWNYTQASGETADADAAPGVTYWMNRLQPLGAAPDIFVTLNPPRIPAAGTAIAAFDYAHPVFDARAMAAQRQLWALQGRRRTWFCGSYFGYGFHEDGLQAGLAAAEDLGGVRRPWKVADESGRIHRGLPAARLPGGVREAAE